MRLCRWPIAPLLVFPASRAAMAVMAGRPGRDRRQRLCVPETLEPTEHRQDHIGEKRRQRDPDERLSKFAPGHKVVINPRDGEIVLPGRDLGHARFLSVLLVRQTGTGVGWSPPART